MNVWKFAAILAAVVALALGINSIAIRFAPPPSIRAIATTTTVRGLALQMSAFVPKNVLRPREPLPVLLTLTNTSAGELAVVRMTWVPNGFALDHQLAFGGKLPAQSTKQLGFGISTEEARGEFSPAMMVWWRGEDGIERWRVVTIGPLRVESGSQTRIIWMARILQLTVKDLGLPLVLAFLGFWFKKKEDTRAAADRAAAEARSIKDHEAAEERSLRDREAAEQRAAKDRSAAESRASRQQVFSILLPKSHDDARLYYLPMQGAADMIPPVYAAYIANRTSVNAADEFYYQIVMFVRRMRHIQLNIGGFLFLSLAGEEVLALSWTGFKRRLDESATKAEIAEVLDLIKDPMLSLAAFNRLAKEAQPLSALRKSMLAWVDQQPGKFDEAMTYHLLFRTVLGHELNRVYELWYGRPLEFDTAAWRVLIEKLEGLEYFTVDLKRYAKAYEAELTAAQSRVD